MSVVSYFPQVWCKFDIRVEDFVRSKVPTTPDLPTVPGDPISKGGFVSLGYDVIPNKCAISLRSYRQGDEARLEIPAGRVPVDPRIIRQVGIHIYAGCLDPNVVAETQGIIQGTPAITLLPQVDPETGLSNEIFRGFIDDWTVVHGDDEDVIQISARDVTGYFLDAELPIDALARIPKNLPLDEVIKLLINGEPGGELEVLDPLIERPIRAFSRGPARKLANSLIRLNARLIKTQVAASLDPENADTYANEIARLNLLIQQNQQALVEAQITEASADSVPVLAARIGLPGARGTIVTNATGSPLPPLGDIKGASWFNELGQTKKGRGGGGSGGRISYWDFITDLCVGSGYICYFRTPQPVLQPGAGSALIDVTPPAELVIDHPRTYYPQTGEDVRKFCFGFNLDRLEITRNYTGRNLPTGIVVSATEDETGRIVTGRFPPEVKKQVNRGTTSLVGSGDREELQRFILKDRLPAASAQQTLLRMAESIYDQISRGEMEVKLETDCFTGFLADYGSGKVDMLRLRPADTIEIEIVPEDLQSELAVTQVSAYESLDTEQRTERLIRLGVDPVLAAAIVVAEDSPFVQKKFRVTDYGIDFDTDNGFNFTIQAINYLDVSQLEDLRTPTDDDGIVILPD